MTILRTPKEARELLSRSGMTVSQVSAKLGVNRHVIRGVLHGRLRGERGDAHKVAVAFGIKAGVIVTDDMSIADALTAAAAAL